MHVSQLMITGEGEMEGRKNKQTNAQGLASPGCSDGSCVFIFRASYFPNKLSNAMQAGKGNTA